MIMYSKNSAIKYSSSALFFFCIWECYSESDHSGIYD